MASIIPSRPVRATRDIQRPITTWTSQVPITTDRGLRDLPIENPWLPLAIMSGSDHLDERHWLTMERDPAISSAMASRISSLLGGGLRLEPGNGPGASELFDFWSWLLAEHPLTTITTLALRSIFRGWECFEAVASWRDWDGKRVFVPISLNDALTWQFRWTAGRDLLYCPGAEARFYRVSRLLSHRMKWWTPRCGGLSNPYGEPLHGKYIVLDYAWRKLSESGLVQIDQSQGFLKLEHDISLGGIDSAKQAAEVAALKAKVGDIITELRSTGVLIQPKGWDFQWQALTSALDGWIKLFQWFGGEARSFYAGANLPTQMTGSSGSRAAAEVQERGTSKLGQVDAAQFAEQFRAGFLRPWSAFNSETISAELPHRGPRPQLDDVPLASVPTLTFVALERMTVEDLEFLKVISEIGVVDSDAVESEVGEAEADGAGTARPDVEAILRQRHVPLLDEGEIGPTLDLAKKEPPPSPFMPMGPDEIEQAAGAEVEDDDEVDDAEPPARGRRR